MRSNRLEALSDGVIAIIITIMVLELKVPHENSVSGLRPMLPKLLAYVLSFVNVGIYWNNHHHLFQATERVSGGVLWANLHVLFWLSLIPVVTDWAGESHFAAVPTAMYGVVLLLTGFAYLILSRALVAVHGPGSTIARAVGIDRKGWLSLAIYAVATAASLYRGWLGASLYALVAMIWLIPDKRIERHLHQPPGEPGGRDSAETAGAAPANGEALSHASRAR
jgi:uncharacterized membrane protein